MPHKTAMFNKAKVKTSSLLDRDGEVNGSCFNPLNSELNPICHLLALLEAHHILHISRIRVKIVVIGGFTDWRCWAVWLPLWLGHCVTLKFRLGPKCLRHVLRRCLNDRNPPTCTASLMNVRLVTVCYALRWNEPAELITVVNRSWCWVSLMMWYDSHWSTSLVLYFVSRFFPWPLSPTPFCRILSREPGYLSLYSGQTTGRTTEER